MTRWFRAGLLGAAVLVAPALLSAQARQGFVPGWERTGLDFSRNGVWRPKGRAVSQTRADLLAAGDMNALNAPMRSSGAGPNLAAVTGVLRVPAIMFSFTGSTAPAQPFTTQSYTDALFGPVAPGGRPYSLRTFYEQLSNGTFSIQGDVSNWVVLSQPEASYTGQPGACAGLSTNGNCNGVWSGNSTALLQVGLKDAIDLVDGATNFALYDNDGPDGVPNSGDDDGFVDIAMFLHAELDGACGGATNNHPWAHRYFLLTTKATNDARTGGGFIAVRDYYIQSAVGGSGACTTSELMGPGTAAHELGHGLGLPDLYDTESNTEGIGQWGLMGSGNYTTAFSPSRMEAWSLNEMGWVTLRPITAGGTYTLGPAPTSDTAFVLTPAGANPRGQRFLIENRQPVQADSAVIRIHCGRSGNPVGCGGGVLIWHVDQSKIDAGAFQNTVNSGAIHGLELVQADGVNDMRNASVNPPRARGDGGDPYPGITSNTAFTPTSTPAANLNNTAFANGAAAGFAIDQIGITGGVASMRINFGGSYRVNANDPAVSISVDGTPTTLFQGLLIDGTSHTLSVVSPQLSGDGRRRFTFASWTDGGLQTHDIVAALAGDTITATMSREHKVVATTVGNGTIGSTPSVDLTGAFVAQNSPLELVATAGNGESFVNWTGDTTTTNATLVLPMGRPYNLTATFSAPVSISTEAGLAAGTMGAPYALQLAAAGGNGTYTWTVTTGTLPPGLTLSTGGALSGIPAGADDYAFTVQATSGAQNATLNATLSVVQPALVQTEVVSLAVTGASALTANDVKYLDLLGNNSGSFDIGDFLAWVRETGATGALREFEAAQRAAQTRTAKEK